MKEDDDDDDGPIERPLNDAMKEIATDDGDVPCERSVIGNTQHRACSWKNPLHLPSAPVRILRATHSSWTEEHPDLLFKWRFPTTRRDCIKITFRSLEKIERMYTTEYHAAINSVLTGFPHSVVRVVSSLGLNYLHPHHKAISQQVSALGEVLLWKNSSLCHLLKGWGLLG